MKEKAIQCNYCGNDAEWVENKEIYGKNYGRSYMVWLCRDCDAYVGCHNNTREPLGTLADKGLRELRKTAKNAFINEKMDGDWKNKKLKGKAYAWLRKELNLSRDEAHFGMFDKDRCRKVIEIIKANSENHGN